MSGPRLLYVGDDGVGTTARDRADALVKLGAKTTLLPAISIPGLLGRVEWHVRARLQTGPVIARTNAALMEACAGNRYEILWIDKGWMIRPSTLERIKNKVGVIVLFNNDNPWGEHERGLWRLHLKIIPLVDEVMTPKYSVVRSYELAGARRVSVVDFGFAPERHFPPPSPVRAEHDISFIGTALRDGGGIRPNRTAMVLQMAKGLPGKISVFGHGWRRALRGHERLFNHIGAGVWGEDYARTIWASRVSLSFITKDNWEELSHRAFEITACGGCLLAERASRLEQSFREDVEAVYFKTADEMADKAAALLDDGPRRQAIAQAGLRRALASGYDNAARLHEAIDRSPLLRPFFPHLRDDVASAALGSQSIAPRV
ncbi:MULTISPECIES: CgeB family protein [Bradyrhizobium]|uniref:CgeB family protein n=1 Tax=Bradyrhizobium TaxID=374 RepID=UPI001EDC4046|nr:glycosyltransferase [Bradyrhizobium zhengyangense]MCG2643793.1 glycosyltransferase [Bradyrhizobium zhengyangense]